MAFKCIRLNHLGTFLLAYYDLAILQIQSMQERQKKNPISFFPVFTSFQDNQVVPYHPPEVTNP